MERNKRKPNEESAEAPTRKLASNWASIVCSGDTPEKRKEEFDKMSRSILAENSRLLLEESFLAPLVSKATEIGLQKMADHHSEKIVSVHLKDIFQSLEICLKPVFHALKSSSSSQELVTFVGRCSIAAKELDINAQAIHKELEERLKKLEERFLEQTSISSFLGSSQLPTKQQIYDEGKVSEQEEKAGLGSWEFRTQAQAETKIFEVLYHYLHKHGAFIKTFLGKLASSELKKLSQEVEGKLEKAFYQPVHKLFCILYSLDKGPEETFFPFPPKGSSKSLKNLEDPNLLSLKGRAPSWLGGFGQVFLSGEDLVQTIKRKGPFFAVQVDALHEAVVGRMKREGERMMREAMREVRELFEERVEGTFLRCLEAVHGLLKVAEEVVRYRAGEEGRKGRREKEREWGVFDPSLSPPLLLEALQLLLEDLAHSR